MAWPRHCGRYDVPDPGGMSDELSAAMSRLLARRSLNYNLLGCVDGTKMVSDTGPIHQLIENWRF
jgi:hypothetical protein